MCSTNVNVVFFADLGNLKALPDGDEEEGMQKKRDETQTSRNTVKSIENCSWFLETKVFYSLTMLIWLLCSH